MGSTLGWNQLVNISNGTVKKLCNISYLKNSWRSAIAPDSIVCYIYRTDDLWEKEDQLKLIKYKRVLIIES